MLHSSGILLNIILPITDPVIKFLIILFIILIVPILSDKIRIPHLLGMILAGVLIGDYGLNLISRDSSIILSGTAGLLYIMFLAGLEIDLNDFKRNAGKSSVLGLYGFIIPMLLGSLAGLFLLKFSLSASILMASMFASHTLITYPIVSKLGISKNRAVNISVGSTLISNVLALIVLAIIVNANNEHTNRFFWILMAIKFLGFSLIILYGFPWIAREFFKRYQDAVLQYIFVLFIVFLGAVLSQLAGIEGIIGAFLAGLAINKLIPNTSPLMNRIDFVGNAIFIPFFLIGVGMLINLKAFITGTETIKVAILMSLLATFGKYLAAVLTRKQLKFTKSEGLLIFGLTNSQAAATLAAVMVGHSLGILNDSVLNGTIVMILVTCTISSFATQRAARRILLSETTSDDSNPTRERILIPISNPATVEELIHFSLLIKSKKNIENILTLNIISDTEKNYQSEKQAEILFDKAKKTAAAADISIKTLLRYDKSSIDGIVSVAKEQNISDIIIGLHAKSGDKDTFFGKIIPGILTSKNIDVFILHAYQPISTLKKHRIIVPEFAEFESGFSFWLGKIWNLSNSTGVKIEFHTFPSTYRVLKMILAKHAINASIHRIYHRETILSIIQKISSDENLILVQSRQEFEKNDELFARIQELLNREFEKKNYIIIYPSQSEVFGNKKFNLTAPVFHESIKQVDIIGNTLAQFLKKRK